MSYKLVSRTTKEVVDTINVRSHTEPFKNFEERKQLDKDAFDRLFEVVRKEENNDGNRLTRF